MKKDKKIWLSPTGLSGMDRCPRCFWLQYNRGIRQPEGIVSRLANRFDVVIKKYFNLYRPLGKLPPMIEGRVRGVLENPFQEIYFYHHDKKYGYYGKLDECLVTQHDLYTPVDHKTSSSDPRMKETLGAYQLQLDSYAWLLEENNKKTSGFGHLIYFYPEHHEELHKGFQMTIHVETLNTDVKQAKKKFLDALKILDDDIPNPSTNCPFCSWYEKIGRELA